MPDILIAPQRGTSNNPTIQFSGSAANSIRLEVLQSGSVAFLGNSGSLFSIVDSMSGSLMSVNDISGLPILEVFSDDKVVMGRYNSKALVVSGSSVGIGKYPTGSNVLDVLGNTSITGSLNVTSGITGSLFGSSSYAITASYALNGGGGGASTVTSSASTSFTLALIDASKYIRTTAATAVSITVPPQSDVVWADSTEMIFEQAGAGQITMITGSGVTINTSETLKSQRQYSVMGIKRVSSDVWTLTGERQLL